MDEAVALAQTLLDRALALDPDLAEAHAVQGLLFLYLRDPARAEPALARALTLNPGQSDTLHWQAELLGGSGPHSFALKPGKRSLPHGSSPTAVFFRRAAKLF